MSTASLPGYTHLPSFNHTTPRVGVPSYSAEPQSYEQRIALNDRSQPRPQGHFVIQSKNGGVTLRLLDQEANASLPVYGHGGVVSGNIELGKTEGVGSVEVKLEGRLHLKEVAGGGTTSDTLCLDKSVLWRKDADNIYGSMCPARLSFSLSLPSTFTAEDKTYPLPPTYEAHLKGVPGFRAWVEYSVSVTIGKPNSSLPKKGSLFSKAINFGNTTISTPLVYFPRSRPAVPVPLRMPFSSQPSDLGIAEAPEWRLFESKLIAKSPRAKDVLAKFYVPTSRVYCVSQSIPFHLIFQSSAFSLAAFLPYGPTASVLSPNKQYTKLQLLRQSVVDVRNAEIFGTKTDIWRVDLIGEGSFRHAGDGPDWISFLGEINISESVKMGGFKARGFTIKDFIVLTTNPPDPTKAPFKELRLVIPVRLTTDPYTADGTGIGIGVNAAYNSSDDGEGPTETDVAEAQTELNY